MIQQAVRSGRAIPPRLLEAPPEVNPGLQLYMDAFWLLCGDRGTSNRITWLSMHMYSRSLGLSEEEEHDMIFLLTRLDITYLKWCDGKQRHGNPTRPQNGDGPSIQANSR